MSKPWEYVFNELTRSLSRAGVFVPLSMRSAMAKDCVAALEAAGYAIVATGDEGHVIEFREDGWTISHPLSCRPKLFDCPVNRVAERELTEPPAALGRFECELNDIGDRLLIGDRVEEERG